jgi:hypothetical protein
MTKRHSIERRERTTLQRFTERVGGRVVGELCVGEEFGWIVSV